MTEMESRNLIGWLRGQGFPDEKIIECLESVEGKKNLAEELVRTCIHSLHDEKNE